MNMDAQALTNEEVKWVWDCLLSMLLATTSQRDSLLSNKVVLGKIMIDLDALNTESFRRWRDFTLRCQPHFRFAHKNYFYLKSHQGVCQSMKRLGGRWWSHWKAVDGDKFVCFDSFNPNDCLVYTFGIRWIFVIVFFFCHFGTFSNDWSFEDSMARLNCTVIKREQSN